jgi:P27 family predicted phage terminase small subunit
MTPKEWHDTTKGGTMRGKKPTPKPSIYKQTPPPPPPELKGEARKEWVRITTLLAAKRVLSEEDKAALTIYSTSWAMYREAQARIEEDGSVVMSATGVPIRNPYLSVLKQAWDRIRPLLSEFGLTPTARARLKVEEPEDDGEFF